MSVVTVLLMLALAIPTQAASATSLVLKFKSFVGENCEYRKSDAGFFLDRWRPIAGVGDLPWESLRGQDLDRRRLDIPIAELPDATEDAEVYFRFYGLHSPHSADHYESELRLTQEFVGQLPYGQPVVLKLKTIALYEAHKNRTCQLEVEFLVL